MNLLWQLKLLLNPSSMAIWTYFNKRKKFFFQNHAKLFNTTPLCYITV